jgi:hypothetical protein
LGYLAGEDFARVEELRNRAGQVIWRLYQAILRKST